MEKNGKFKNVRTLLSGGEKWTVRLDFFWSQVMVSGCFEKHRARVLRCQETHQESSTRKVPPGKFKGVRVNT